MIIFFAGFATGFSVALVSAFCAYMAKVKAEATKEPSAAEARLNEEKKKREKELHEKQRQFDMLMKYTGEKQK